MDEILEPSTEIKVDMRDVADFHHGEHHLDWIIVRNAISGAWGHRYELRVPSRVRRLR